MLNRRRVLASGLLIPTFGAVGSRALAADDGKALFKDLETRSGGRLGVSAHDLKTGKRLVHRAGERFPMCSTFKLLAVSAVLQRVADEPQKLQLWVPYTKTDLVAYSPITELHVSEGGMALGDLCEAAITHSDNTAGNLILKSLAQQDPSPPGIYFYAPSEVTSFARSLGDRVTRLDRMETDLNEARPGDPRDTTSPDAMLADMRQVLLGDTLTVANRNRLIGWLVGNTTGANRIRAGMPEGWTVGDKTGAGSNGTTNDVGIIWPEGRGKAPILLACYLTGSTLDSISRDQIVAQAARAAVHILRGVPNHG